MAMKLHTLEEMTDRYIGPIGTPKRDAFEQKLAAELHAYHVGEAIRQAREANNPLASMMRAFKALGVQVALDMKGIGRVAL